MSKVDELLHYATRADMNNAAHYRDIAEGIEKEIREKISQEINDRSEILDNARELGAWELEIASSTLNAINAIVLGYFEVKIPASEMCWTHLQPIGVCSCDFTEVE